MNRLLRMRRANNSASPAARATRCSVERHEIAAETITRLSTYTDDHGSCLTNVLLFPFVKLFVKQVLAVSEKTKQKTIGDKMPRRMGTL